MIALQDQKRINQHSGIVLLLQWDDDAVVIPALPFLSQEYLKISCSFAGEIDGTASSSTQVNIHSRNFSRQKEAQESEMWGVFLAMKTDKHDPEKKKAKQNLQFAETQIENLIITN